MFGFKVLLLNSCLPIFFITSIFPQDTKEDHKIKSPDYKIIISNESFIELEYYPDYKKDYDFKNSSSNTTGYGHPNIRNRTFPVYFPVNINNRVEVIDSKYEEVTSVEIKPVPTFKYSKDKNELAPEFNHNKDEKIYNENKFYPSEVSSLIAAGALRNKYFGYLIIYPSQYNPVTQILRKHSYIRIRITFGGNPVYSNKKLSKEEKIFLYGIAINSNEATHWSTKEFSSIKDNPVQNSVLATGHFYKLEVKETAIYKLDKNYLQAAGINVNSIDPRTIKIYGNGGMILPFDNFAPVPIDLVENRIFVSGEDDGKFNDNDYILFYGKSPHQWIYDTLNQTYIHLVNHFSNSNYYWITYGNSNGRRMQVINSPNQSGINPLQSFKDRLFDEPEIINPGSTGYLWVSSKIGVNEGYTFNKELRGYYDGSFVNFRFRFGNGGQPPNYWRLEDLNSNFLINQVIHGTIGFSGVNLEYLNMSRYGVSYPLDPGKSSINFKASLPSSNNNSPNVAGVYDYYEVHYDRVFSADSNTLRFNSPDTNATIEFQINSFTSSDIKILNVTEHSNVNLINPISFSNGVLRYQVNIVKGSPHEYYAIGGANFKTPVSISARIPNQNLKGDLLNGAGFIIITPKEFLQAANRLKALRERAGTDYIKTAIVEIEKIYNEFSGGLQDPVAMRNFIKYSYNNWQERPVYIMFMGDGSYDYKNIYNLYNANLKNWIPPIEKDSDFSNDIDSYCSDDYIVEINESYIEPGDMSIPDFAAGRICSNTLEEANSYIDKIISYEDAANYDQWRNENLYIADDGWTTENTGGQEGSLFTNQSEEIAERHTPNHVERRKVYIVSYPTEITSQGRRKPGANIDIIKEWNKGKLLINFYGHLSNDVWAHERIFGGQDIIQLNNKDKYPFLTIPNGDYIRWDDPFIRSTGIQLIDIKDKGIIGIYSAVRPVYSIQGATFNNLFWDNLFMKDSLNLPARLGHVIFNVKQSLNSDNDLKMSLICDPTLRIGTPKFRTRIDSINNTPGGHLFHMKSLQKVKISGSVLKPDSSFWQDYSGTLSLKLYDVDKQIRIIDFGFLFQYKLFGGIIFTGRTNIVNGLWTLEFIVPRDISNDTGRGRINAYFKNDISDGLGFTDKFVLSGIDSTAAVDSTGPKIQVYIDSRNFRTGDIVNQNPKMLIDFFDESGLNVTGTIGHKIEAILNDDGSNSIDLTPFYNATTGYQNGTAEYQFQNLLDGKYNLRIKAWDTYNNSGVSEIDFNVKSNSGLALENVYNYPNPMKDFTNFVFNHNYDSPLTAEIKIYIVSGRLIKALSKKNIIEKFVSVDWNGRDNDGDAISNGTYIYKLIIKAEDGNISKSSVGKLAVLR